MSGSARRIDQFGPEIGEVRNDSVDPVDHGHGVTIHRAPTVCVRVSGTRPEGTYPGRVEGIAVGITEGMFARVSQR